MVTLLENIAGSWGAFGEVPAVLSARFRKQKIDAVEHTVLQCEHLADAGTFAILHEMVGRHEGGVGLMAGMLNGGSGHLAHWLVGAH